LSHHVAQLGALTEEHQTATDAEISALLDSVRSLLMPSEGMKESAGNYDALQRMPN
jgi:hypothetical protein